MECTVIKIDKDNRIFLPHSLLKHAEWITGDKPLKAWLLVAAAGRCRLLSSPEFEGDASCRSLQASIDAESGQSAGSLVEFRDEASVVLGLRLLPIEITPPGPGWRLTLPRALAAIMQIEPKKSSVALFYSQAHIEIWTLDTLRASMAVPLTELI
jgi:hypothetical protein